jgi:hypothetical protein
MIHKVGWHLQNMASVSVSDWRLMENYARPVSVVFLTGERVGADQIKRVLGISPGCHIFFRPYFDAKKISVEQHIENVKLIINPDDPMMKIVPEGQGHLQIFNEQNMPHTTEIGHPDDQWEGFGSTVDDMTFFNGAFCWAYDTLKAINPALWIGFPPLTGGNRDAYFRTDPEHVPYYMHGPEAAFGDPCDPNAVNPSQADILAAIRSGPCYEALKKADEYLVHTYVANDAEHQMHELWAGERFVQYAKFFPKPMNIWITELGIGDPVQNWTRWYELLDKYPEVKGTGIWMLGTGDWQYASDAARELKLVTNGETPGNPVPGPAPKPEPKPEPPPVSGKERCRVGICGRNDYWLGDKDYELLLAANVETVKMMSHTNPSVFREILIQKPDIQIITRLYMSGAFGPGKHPTPEMFVKTMVPVIRNTRLYCNMYEVHNEPNHLDEIEGWGQSDEHARDFNLWAMKVYILLRKQFPYETGIRFGFPGLAVPHNDLKWLEICREAIEMYDFLCVHCYWQNPEPEDQNHLSTDWGMRFVHYHEQFPGKELHITEYGNSNHQSGYKSNWLVIAEEHVEYFQELFKYDIVSSASAFIMSSPDPAWMHFAWRSEDGTLRGVVRRIGEMDRPPLVPEQPLPKPPSYDEITRVIHNRAWNETGIAFNPDAAFYHAAQEMGLGRPVTNEFEEEIGGVIYSCQAYDGGILWCVKGEWKKIRAMPWL